MNIKKIIIGCGLITLILGGFYLSFELSPGNRVCKDFRCVDVEVVQDKESRVQGLQFRESLDANTGMLFIFDQNRRHGFWMKNTLIPLDMLWIDYARRVVDIAENVPPCEADPCPVYTPDNNAIYVLEVNAGHAGRMGIKKGDVLNFKIKDL